MTFYQKTLHQLYIVNNLSTAGHEDWVKLYFSSLRSILDQHAPVQKRLLPIRPHSPWYTDEITQTKKARRCEKQ